MLTTKKQTMSEIQITETQTALRLVTINGGAMYIRAEEKITDWSTFRRHDINTIVISIRSSHPHELVRIIKVPFVSSTQLENISIQINSAIIDFLEHVGSN